MLRSTAVLLLCMLGGGIALGVKRTAAHRAGPGLCRGPLDPLGCPACGLGGLPGAAARPVSGRSPAAAGTAPGGGLHLAGVQIIFFAECICQMIGLEISADGMKRYLDSWLFFLSTGWFSIWC